MESVLCGAAHHSAAQHSEAQRSTAQHSGWQPQHSFTYYHCVPLKPALNCSLLPNNISLVFSSVLLSHVISYPSYAQGLSLSATLVERSAIGPWHRDAVGFFSLWKCSRILPISLSDQRSVIGACPAIQQHLLLLQLQASGQDYV